MSKENNFLGLIACGILFNLAVVVLQVRFNQNIANEVKELKSYSERFIARDKEHVIVMTPKELVFKIRGQSSLRLQLRKSKKHLYLRAKPN